MTDIKIEQIYDGFLNYLIDSKNIKFIWFQDIKINAFFDNLFKFYFFKEGVNNKFYPMCNFTKENTEKPEIIAIWNSYKKELFKFIPVTNNPHRPSEFRFDLVWIDKNGNMPFCMEMEKEKNLNEILVDFTKLIYFKSKYKVMLFQGHSYMTDIISIISRIPFSKDETYLLISYEYKTNKIDPHKKKNSVSLKSKVIFKETDENGLHEKDLNDGTFFFFDMDGSISPSLTAIS